MSKKDPFRLRIGDEFNPEKRCGMPRWSGGKKGVGTRYLTTWFTTGSSWKWADERLLEKLHDSRVIRGNCKWVLVEFTRSVYYSDGRFYRCETRKSVERSGAYVEFVPIDGAIRTCKPRYQSKYGLPDAEIICIEGYPVSLRMGDEAFDVNVASWPAMESFLGLDEMYKPEGYRPKKVA